MQIIGHKTQWELLRRIGESGRIPQAFIFSGENSLGKQRVAQELVKLLNCEESNFSNKPCQTCFSCCLIEKRRHPDLVVVEPQNKPSDLGDSVSRREIQISQIRDLQRVLSFHSQLSSFKSVIIDEAQTLRPEAQSCLLKTLEEPKGKTLFLLITARPEMLLETIRSRSALLKFYPVSEKEMKRNFSPEIVALSEGRPGKALNFLRNPDLLSQETKEIKEIQLLLKKDLPERFIFAGNFAKENSSQDLQCFFERLLKHLRNSLLRKCEANQNLKAEIEMVEDLKFLLSTTNLNQRLLFETLMLSLGSRR